MKILLLEDDPRRIFAFKQRFLDHSWSWTSISTARECIDALRNKSFDLIFLDHDLNGEQMVSTQHPNTGSEVARFWGDNSNQNKLTPVVVHSFNPMGAKYMLERIKHATHIPGVWMEDIFKTFLENRK